LITDLTADTPLRTTVRISGPLDALPALLAQQLRAVLLEAVSNVVRHANATDLMVTISVDDVVAVE
jgi:signal transduction histidine kinase